MPKIYIKDANSILSDVIGDFEITNKYQSADTVVCWNDIEGDCRETILNANYLGIPTIVSQHGLRATREYAYPFNAPLIADKIMVWGPKDKKRLIQSGLDENRVIVTGTTIFDHLIPRKSHEGINVVFAPMHWDTNLDENRMVAEKLREITGIHVTTKLIDDMDGSYFDNPIYSKRTGQNHLKICASVLSSADLIVGINESTFEFLAYKQDIPVIVVNLWKPKLFRDRLFFQEIDSFFSNACQKIELKDLEKEIFNTLNNPEKFRPERRKALYDEAGVGFDGFTSRQRMVDVINASINQRHSGQRLLSQKEIVETASRKLLNQLSIKQANSQQMFSKLKLNLEEIKLSNLNSNNRIYERGNASSLRFNPMDYPICFSTPLRLESSSAWIEHIPFGMFVIDILRPKVLVELGTHTGVSYSAFCQAVKQLGLNTKCYAIDNWRGDIHSGFYGEEILIELNKYHDLLYSEFSRLIPTSFDEATKFFSDGSIDLLHIDGLHTYDAVKHDFETWLPKLSDQGVVIFHDTNVRERDFGVWKLWDELKMDYPSFEFFHGYGLGILAVGKDYPLSLDVLLKTEEQENTIRDFFFQQGLLLQKEVSIQSLNDQLAQTKEELSSLLTSKSWWITRPLRRISNLLKSNK